MTPVAQTIDEVVESLTTIVDDAIARESRMGYFAALYRKVTIDIREKIDRGVFDDGPRMERLDVIFANRYLAAVRAHESGEETSDAWSFAFDVTEQRRPIVLQHLLLGMNAHINLDLGIAAAQTVSQDELADLKPDFDRINKVLADLVGQVQDELAQIWIALRLLNRYLGHFETAIINFSMQAARDHAWSVAERLAPLSGDTHQAAVSKIDQGVTDLARAIRHPGPLLSAVTGLVRIGERGSIRRKIEILE